LDQNSKLQDLDRISNNKSHISEIIWEEPITVLWPPCGGRSVKLQHMIAFCHVMLCQVMLVPKSPVVSSFRQLLEAGADGSLQRRKRQSQDLLQPYIAAKLDALPEIFTLGDEKTYNGYYNKALPGQQQYRCFVLADLTDHESVSDLYVCVRACTARQLECIGKL